MIEKDQTIYLDEAGFTGNNLLDVSQPTFVYASVALDEEVARNLQSEAICRFRIDGNELKGSSLVKHRRGRRAITWLLERCNNQSLIFIANKEYSLAAKFFEYIFEPLLSERNSLLYRIGFHKFITMALYIHFAAGENGGDRLLMGFQELMRTRDPQRVQGLYATSTDMTSTIVLDKILTFVICNEARIKSEVERLGSYQELSNWILDLSTSAVNFLLASWGEQFKSLTVYCDQSNPIKADLTAEKSWFAQMIGREDKFYVPFGLQPSPSMIYNLSRPICLVNSMNFPGVQVADVVASSVAHAMRNPEDELHQEWLTILGDSVANAMVPDSDLLDLDQPGPLMNSFVLQELTTRSVKGESLADGLAEYISEVRQQFITASLDELLQP